MHNKETIFHLFYFLQHLDFFLKISDVQGNCKLHREAASCSFTGINYISEKIS